ncbi:MAG: serine hydrolase [Hyphomicrobiales bacterium]|nr:serine hydrolase [Hyphomicrobiales bacterium]
MSDSRVALKRWGTLAAGLAIAVGLVSTADARRHHWRRHHHHYRHHAAVPTAEIVVDGNSGRVLYAHNENEPRHPASITKVMTLYLLFEQLEKGRLTMETPLRVSAHAAAQAPSKLGLRPGQTIEVEDAIKAIVTKSANDVAVTIAEAIGGDEEHFAEIMTERAHQLGMTRTHYANASGLPNNAQITTARDLAILGRAIQSRFPKYYGFFSTHSFTYAGRTIRTHNHLLGRVEGVDGIKTGYTNASGFNLLTSVHRDGRHIVAAVLGGRTARARDMLMASLIEDNLDSGSKTRTQFALNQSDRDDEAKEAAVEARREREPEPRAVETRRQAEEDVAPPAPVRAAPVRVAYAAPMSLNLAVPTPPARIAERPRPAYVAAVKAPAREDEDDTPVASLRKPAPIANDGSTRKVAHVAAATTTPAMRWVVGPQPAARPRTVAKAETKTEAGKTIVARAELAPAARPGKSWMIQIGATDDVGKAHELLAKAKSRSRAVAAAQPMTEKIQKGSETLYRARFAGLQEASAHLACSDLKRSGFSCFAARN